MCLRFLIFFLWWAMPLRRSWFVQETVLFDCVKVSPHCVAYPMSPATCLAHNSGAAKWVCSFGTVQEEIVPLGQHQVSKIVRLGVWCMLEANKKPRGQVFPYEMSSKWATLWELSTSQIPFINWYADSIVRVLEGNIFRWRRGSAPSDHLFARKGPAGIFYLFHLYWHWGSLKRNRMEGMKR